MLEPGGALSAGDSRLERTIATCRTILFALASSVFVYVVVGTIVSQQDAAAQPSNTYRIPLVAGALGALVGSVMFRRLNLSFTRVSQIHATKGASGVIDHLFRTTIVSAALGEAVGIFGLLVGILSADTYTMYALCAAAVVAILFSLPQANGWRELYQQISVRGAAG